MKNIALFLAMIFVSCVAMKAQNNKDKFKIGLSASLEDNSGSETVNFDKYSGYSVDYNQSNYRVGLNFEYLFTENISINTSVNYSIKDFTGTYYCAVCDLSFIPSAQEIEFRFIEVPLTMKYYFLPNRVRLYGELGINNLFSLNKDVVDNSYGLAIKIGGGVVYNLTEKLSIQAGIDYNKGITKFYDDSEFKLKTVALGIGIMTRL